MDMDVRYLYVLLFVVVVLYLVLPGCVREFTWFVAVELALFAGLTGLLLYMFKRCRIGWGRLKDAFIDLVQAFSTGLSLMIITLSKTTENTRRIPWRTYPIGDGRVWVDGN